ncbi:hypothetical protein HDU86_004427 [Geranomyces michiganensis]|nr:hypothetical protein HDU86_004427 [Geranomyces michiganensis]
MPPIPAVPGPKPTFSELPLELSVQVAKYLDAVDIARLARTSRHFAAVSQDNQIWASLSTRRFGSLLANATATGAHNHREEFKQLLSANSLTCPATRLRIIWLTPNTHWWSLIPAPATNPPARSPLVAQLNVVHWFDVRSTTAGVPRGEYVPTFRLRFLRNSHTSLDRINLRAWTVSNSADGESGDVNEQSSTSTRVEKVLGDELEPLRVDEPMGFFVARNLPEEWVDICLPVLKIEEEYATVVMEMTDHSTARPKQGLMIDCFELVPNIASEEREVSQQSQDLHDKEAAGDHTPGSPTSELQLPDTVINSLRWGGATIAGAVRSLAGL